MKRIFAPFSLLVFLISLVQCSNPCKTVGCENDGLCREGECYCQKWYTGDHCELKFNRNYSGTYYGALTSDSINLMRITDSITMVALDEPNRLWCGLGFYMDFDSDSTVAIPNQLEEDQSGTTGFSVEGKGFYEVNWIQFNVQRFDASGTLVEEVTFVGEKVEK